MNKIFIFKIRTITKYVIFVIFLILTFTYFGVDFIQKINGINFLRQTINKDEEKVNKFPEAIIIGGQKCGKLTCYIIGALISQ